MVILASFGMAELDGVRRSHVEIPSLSSLRVELSSGASSQALAGSVGDAGERVIISERRRGRGDTAGIGHGCLRPLAQLEDRSVRGGQGAFLLFRDVTCGERGVIKLETPSSEAVNIVGDLRRGLVRGLSARS